MMHFSITWTILLLCGLQTADVFGKIEIPPEVRRPPRITSQSDSIVYAIAQVELKLKCAADALPDVAESAGYTWEKNGSLLPVFQEDDANKAADGDAVMSSVNGDIRFKNSNLLSEEELSQFEGKYQCFPSNGIGTAMTDIMNVKVAMTPPYQVPQNFEIFRREGSSLFLPCNYSSPDGRKITWTVPETSNHIMQDSQGGLIFSNVQYNSDNDLNFWCTIKDLGTRKSTDGPHYTLRVNRDNPAEERAPAILSPVSNPTQPKLALRGDDLVLQCIAIGNPTPDIQWEVVRGGWPEGRYSIENEGRTVTIRNVSDADQTSYRCVATNSAGEDSVTVTVKVKSRPYFRTEDHIPRDAIRTPGKSVIIRCQPYGKPKPTLKWWVNGRPISEAPAMENRVVVNETRIKITNLKESDSAVYQCISSNQYGSLIKQAMVQVLTSKPIPLSNNAPSYRQVEGNSLTMNCSFFGSPPPTVTCRKDGNDVTTQDRFSLRNNKFLKVVRLERNDQGVYACEALNEYGRASINLTLNVLERTQLIANTNSVSVEKGKSAQLKVRLVADPSLENGAKITWIKLTKVVGQTDTFSIENTKESDAGTYTVSAATELDKANTYITVIVKDKPLPPQTFDFAISDQSQFKVLFSWTPGFDNYDAITEYKIEFEENDYEPGRWQTLQSSLKDVSAELDLSPYVNYAFRIKAKNSLGWSKPGSTTRRYRTPSGPPVNPTGVRGEGTAPDNMVISWDAINGIQRNGPNLNYIVRYRKANANTSHSWKTTVVDESQNNFTVENTLPYQSYHIKVTSKNEIGNASMPKTVTGYSGEDVPLLSPSSLTAAAYENSPTIIQLTWDPVSPESVRGKLLGYKIRYQKTGSKTAEKEVIANADATSKNISDLLPFTNYIFSVSPFNKVASAETVSTVRKMTPEGVPGPPSNLNVKQRNATSITITWEAPKDMFGQIIAYGVDYRCLNDTSDKASISLDQSKLSKLQFTIAGLQPTFVYDISMNARTLKGPGNSTSSLEVKLPSAVPFVVKINQTTEDSVTFMMSPVHETDKLQIEHKAKSGDASKKWISTSSLPIKQTVHLQVVKGLQPGTDYYFRLTLAKANGDSNVKIVEVKTSNTGLATGGVTSQVWFIVIMCLIGVIILVILIICFMKKQKGGRYSVAEKEGRLVDPESQPMNKEEMGEYNDEIDGANVKKPLTTFGDPSNGGNPTTPSDGYSSAAPAPLRTRGDSVGGDSIEAFGDVEAKEFNEDGSFIGQYGVIQGESADSSVVSPNGDASVPTQEADKVV